MPLVKTRNAKLVKTFRVTNEMVRPADGKDPACLNPKISHSTYDVLAVFGVRGERASASSAKPANVFFFVCFIF